VTRLNKDHFPAIVRYGAFADLTVCITEFSKVSKYQKISLLAIAMLRGIIPVMLECPECSLKVDNQNPDLPMDDEMIRYWFPVLFGFYDIIMNGEDLEVRRLYVLHPLCPQFLISSQCPRLTLHHAQNLWLNISFRVLGYSLPRTAFPYVCGAQVKPRFITFQYARGHERLAFNDNDPSPSRSY
jgi:hypothetical protein